MITHREAGEQQQCRRASGFFQLQLQLELPCGARGEPREQRRVARGAEARALPRRQSFALEKYSNEAPSSTERLRAAIA